MVVRRALEKANFISQGGNHQTERLLKFLLIIKTKKKLIFFAVKNKKEAANFAWKRRRVLLKRQKLKLKKNQNKGKIKTDFCVLVGTRVWPVPASRKIEYRASQCIECKLLGRVMKNGVSEGKSPFNLFVYAES